MFFFVAVLHVAGQAPLVSLQDGKLTYTLYANQGQENAVNQVPDFSSAGYRGGGVRLPEVPVKETVLPDTGDVKAAIQRAIDRVAALPADANGFRGAVLLKTGIYHVGGSLFIRESGVVLRGEGNSLDGTVLIATQRSQHNLIEVRGTGSGFGEVAGSKARITTAYVPTGTRTFSVASHAFRAGDEVVVQKTPNEAWINALDMARHGWAAADYKTQFERKIVAVNGNVLTLDAPIVDPIETVYGGGEVYKSDVVGRISETGVENLRLESVFRNNADESHGWNAIQFNRAENSWVKKVVVKYFGYSAVRLSNLSRYNTIEDCAMIDPKSQTTGSRKYSFDIESNSSNNLFQRCMTWGGRHDYVTGSRVPGPNVFLDCFSDNTQSDIGPHHRWATGLLFDNVYGGQIRVRNRGASGTGHGWAGAQAMFWNCQSYKSDFLVESPPTARNWAVGAVGVTQGVGEDPSHNGYWESWGAHVPLRSLYLQQLRERLGEQAVSNIVIPEQLQGNLWAALRAKTEQILAEEPVYQEPLTAGDPEAFDLTDNGGILTSQYESNRPDENFQNIIDNDTNTKYYQNGKKALWVQYKSVVPAIVTSYTITSGRDADERDPKDWNLQGSDDGRTWTTLDVRADEDFPARKQTRTFHMPENLQPFIYYRLNITLNGNNNNTQFAEWELFQRKTQQISFGEITEVTYGDDPFQLVASASSDLPVTLSVLSGPATVETIDGEAYLRITGAGSVTLQASQAGDEKYFPATASYTFEVGKAAQELTFDAMLPKNTAETVLLSAVSSAGLPVSYSVISGPGSVEGNVLTFSAEGEVVIAARQEGNANHEAATPVQQTLLVFEEDAKRDGVLLIMYPNPTRGQLKVKLENRKDKDYTFVLYDSSGNPVASSVLARSHKMFELDFDLQQNPDGDYYLHVTDGTAVWVRRILKR